MEEREQTHLGIFFVTSPEALSSTASRPMIVAGMSRL